MPLTSQRAIERQQPGSKIIRSRDDFGMIGGYLEAARVLHRSTGLWSGLA